jgi:kinesin family protein C1
VYVYHADGFVVLFFFPAQATAEDMTQKYRKESGLRRKLHNTLADLKGQIRVFCRVRPLSPKELAESQGEDASSVRFPSVSASFNRP